MAVRNLREMSVQFKGVMDRAERILEPIDPKSNGDHEALPEKP
jgi:hypothetical protein